MPEEVNESLAHDVAPERTTEELDKLADGTELARNTERPMSEKAPAPAKGNEESFEFEHGGKKIKGTREQLIKWAQMGYDRPQAMQKFNQEKLAWDKQKADWEKNWGVYRQIDEFANQNKDWWNHVNQAWQTRGQVPTAPAMQAGQPQPGLAPDPRLSSLEQKLAQFEQFTQTIMQERVSEKERAEDQALDQEIQSIRQSHKDLDWDSLDENGKSLEARILEHAQTSGIPTFKAAMRDLLHEELITRAQSQAKLSVAKGIQQQTKLGVLGTSPTPQKWSPKSNKPIREQNYEDIMDEIREEIRSGRV